MQALVQPRSFCPSAASLFARRVVKFFSMSSSASSYGGGPTQPFSFSVEPASSGTLAEYDGAVGSH